MNIEEIIRSFVRNELLDSPERSNFQIINDVYFQIKEKHPNINIKEQDLKKQIETELKKEREAQGTPSKREVQKKVYEKSREAKRKKDRTIEANSEAWKRKQYWKNAERSEKVKGLIGKISRAGVFEVTHNFKKGDLIIYGDRIRKAYHTLIGRKTLKDDKKLMNDILEYRKTILQKRIVCHANLYAKEGLVAGIKIFQILIEHGQQVADFWEGLEIDPSSFTTTVSSFAGIMAINGVSKVEISMHPTKRTQVREVTTQFIFA